MEACIIEGQVALLLPEDTQTAEERINLANRISDTFLRPQLAYEPLCKDNCLDTTNITAPKITTETVFSLLSRINTFKSNGPDNIPNWVLKE